MTIDFYRRERTNEALRLPRATSATGPFMVRTGYDRLVVVDAERPVGLVTRSAVAQFLQLHKA